MFRHNYSLFPLVLNFTYFNLFIFNGKKEDRFFSSTTTTTKIIDDLGNLTAETDSQNIEIIYFFYNNLEFDFSSFHFNSS
jgi:hypothetical protein